MRRLSDIEEATRDTISRISSSGADMSREMLVDFFIDFQAEEKCRDFANLLERDGFKCELRWDNEDSVWALAASKSLLVNTNNIINIEKMIEKEAMKCEGEYTGFGSFGN